MAADSSPCGPPLDDGSRAEALVQRWLRLQMHVRCGLSPVQPGCVRVYVHMGEQVACRRLRPAVTVHLRMLRTLLAAARDDTLPWFWRSVCLEQVKLPLAQLSRSLGVHDPLGLQSIEMAVQRARERFPAAPPSAAGRAGPGNGAASPGQSAPGTGPNDSSPRR